MFHASALLPLQVGFSRRQDVAGERVPIGSSNKIRSNCVWNNHRALTKWRESVQLDRNVPHSRQTESTFMISMIKS